ncbi:unnamed protein product [Nyctereutes procyonoides]|uniref:(raccoon dog) hypothetical protein n=1 Tax=Nyctereutes procyonoides TaxID=34880 RepID=A0A811YW47_NYCPR|nr:unnamed protein product [Nyctereutes procyonoides]
MGSPPPGRARGTGSPAVGPGPERSCPRTRAREAGGSGREGSQVWGWGGARSRRERNVEISRRQTWEPRRRAQLAGDTGFPGEKAGRTEVRTFSLSPIPHPARGGASSTHVSGKERKCQIAPHPLVSDGQPGTVALKLGVKSPVFLLLPPTPFPAPFLIGQRFSSKAVAANEWAGHGDPLRRWGESWPSKGHVRMYWRRRGEWGWAGGRRPQQRQPRAGGDWRSQGLGLRVSALGRPWAKRAAATFLRSWRTLATSTRPTRTSLEAASPATVRPLESKKRKARPPPPPGLSAGFVM